MAKTRHYRKRTRINNKRTRKHKGGVGSSPKLTIVKVPESARKNVVISLGRHTYTISKENLKKMLTEDERGKGPTYM